MQIAEKRIILLKKCDYPVNKNKTKIELAIYGNVYYNIKSERILYNETNTGMKWRMEKWD